MWPFRRREPETRAAYQNGFAGMALTGSRTANVQLAENLGTVTACVNAIGSVMGSLPPLVFRSGDGGRMELPSHPVARMIRNPWSMMTWPDWIEWAMGSVLLHGNALAEIVHDGAGRVTGLRPIPWQSVAPVLLGSGRLAFDVSSYPQPRRRLLDTEVFYLKDRSDDGLVGRSRISRAPDVVGNAVSLQDFAGNAWENQATPSGAIEIASSLTQPQFDRVTAAFDRRHTGVGNARRVLVLDNDAKWKPLSVSPEDAEVLGSRRFSVEELCRLFQVPPPIVQDYTHNTFTNSAQASLWFAQFSLAPWCRKIEAEFARSVFNANDGTHLEIDLSGLMRGDFETRWKAWEIAVKNDILDRNEVRDIEGWGPRAVTAGARI